MRRVHWMELFFDLVFVVFIGQLAHTLHGEPELPQFAAFLFVFAIGWWAWVNVTATINILPNLPVRRLAVIMLLGMIAVGAMAVAAPEAVGDRAWLFAFGSAGLRLILLPLWFFRAKRMHLALWRPMLYNGLTAALWIGSAFVPQPAQFVVWAVAVGLEVALITIARSGDTLLADELDIPHLAERLGLFVIIVMGESVFSVIEALSAHWALASGAIALLGLVLIGLLAWTYFLHGALRFEEGLEAAFASRNTIAIRDATMFMPYLMVAGVTMMAAGLSTAIEHPDDPLSLGSAIAVFVGLVSFYLTTGVVGIRLGRPPTWVIPWMLLGSLAPLAGLAVTLLFGLPALGAVALATGIVGALTVYTELESRMPHVLEQDTTPSS